MAARSSFSVVLFAILLACLGTIGCGGPTTYEVTGEVKYDGNPIPQGLIRFVPTDGMGQPNEAVIADGKYSLEISPGPKSVAIYGSRKIGQRRGMGPDSPMVDETEQYIPVKYNDQSTLTAEISNSDPQNFDLPK